jgi:hypothetical protein
MTWLVGCSSGTPPPASKPAATSEKPASDEDVPSACASGVEQTEATSCGTMARGLCFTREVEACACAGCAQGKCTTSFSFPPQVVCE